jgi:phospholipid transport system substrate-binding protein
MKQMYQKISGAILMLAMATLLVTTQGVAAIEKTPKELVEQTTKELFASVKARSAATKKSDAYYDDVEKILDSVVDFPFIARAVMRKTAKNATPEQVDKFSDVFKKGLIKTYAKGIANYADSDIKTLPVDMAADATKVSVDQEVSDKGSIHKLQYSMKRNKTGEWKLINVVLNGVNLGESFTSQFDQAMTKYDNDVDKVIANWLAAN